VPDPAATPPAGAPRPPADHRPLDPADHLVFWGRERASLARPGLAAWFDRVRHDPRAGGVALLAVALVVGLVWYRMGARGADVRAPSAAPGTTRPARSGATSTTRRAELVVHVAGAVARPGIVRLADGARVVDAIDAAGGPRPDADLDRLNLAAEVVDGQRVAVGRPGAPLGDATGADVGDPAVPGGAPGAAAPLNLNTATQVDLETLPGIGPVLGAAILRERERRGGFGSVEDLRSVRGIGEQRFADLRPLVTV
jgi:competence protein ComEA